MRFGLDFTIVMSSICNLNDAMNCCQDFSQIFESRIVKKHGRLTIALRPSGF
jgi:hypothetical protein